MPRFGTKLKAITKLRVLVICQDSSPHRDVEEVSGWGLLFLAPCLSLRWTSCHGSPGHGQTQPAVTSPSPQAGCSWRQQLRSQQTGLLHQRFSPPLLCSHCHAKGQRCRAPACSVLCCTWLAGSGRARSSLPSSFLRVLQAKPTPSFLKPLTVQGQINNIINTH